MHGGTGQYHLCSHMHSHIHAHEHARMYVYINTRHVLAHTRVSMRTLTCLRMRVRTRTCPQSHRCPCGTAWLGSSRLGSAWHGTQRTAWHGTEEKLVGSWGCFLPVMPTHIPALAYLYVCMRTHIHTHTSQHYPHGYAYIYAHVYTHVST